MAWAEEVLGAVGAVVRVPESALDAVTGLPGSGPAYVFLVAKAMVEGGVLAGLPREVAETLAFRTLLGSSRLLVDGGVGPAALRAAVTSPGATDELAELIPGTAENRPRLAHDPGRAGDLPSETD